MHLRSIPAFASLKHTLNRAGFHAMWVPWIFVIILLAVLILSTFWFKQQVQEASSCTQNLKTIFTAIEQYEDLNGRLPELDYYPSVVTSERSLLTVLSGYGVNSDNCTCPSSHDLVQQRGLGYLWNVDLNKRPRSMLRGKEWMLIEIEASMSKVTNPHLGRFHILYTDGSIEQSRVLPPGFPSDQK